MHAPGTLQHTSSCCHMRALRITSHCLSRLPSRQVPAASGSGFSRVGRQLSSSSCSGYHVSVPHCTATPGSSGRLRWKPHPTLHLASSASTYSNRCSSASAPRAGSSNGSSGKASDVGEKPFVITTPLYYVNAAPHLGGAYSTMSADVIARYQRLRGRRVRFVTGTDEHGEKIAAAAAAAGLEPQAHCDAIVAQYRELWQQLDISYDAFIRTTDAKHEEVVAAVLQRVMQSDDIYKADYEGWYCVDCEEYKDEGDMDPDKNCPVHRRPCRQRAEANYFFRLSRYQQQIEELLADPQFCQPASRRNEVLGWVKDGLRDFSISRAAVRWGIPIPNDPSQTIYVWFDALVGYLSALVLDDAGAGVGELTQRGWPADVHVIGKDILRFHTVYWPGMLLSAGLPLPRRVFGHGFLTSGGLKMGKALGNVIDPKALVAAYGADAVRYYFIKDMEFGKDGDFSEERFRAIVNANLANDIGNLLNRTLNLLKKNCASTLPAGAGAIPENHPLRAAASQQVPAACAAYEAMRFDVAGEAILGISGRGNQFLEETAPWTALKKGNDEEKAAAALCLVAVLEAVRIVAVLLSPITPALSRRIYAQLGLAELFEAGLAWGRDAAWGGLREGHVMPPPQPVFARLEGDLVVAPPLQSAAVAAA